MVHHADPAVVKVSVVVNNDTKFVETFAQQYPNSVYKLSPILCMEGSACVEENPIPPTPKPQLAQQTPIPDTSTLAIVLVSSGLVIVAMLILLILLKRPRIKHLDALKGGKIKQSYIMSEVQ